jgi:hypothetical protein
MSSFALCIDRTVPKPAFSEDVLSRLEQAGLRLN